MFFQFVDSLIQAKSQTTTKNSQEFLFIHSKSKEKGGRDEKNPLKIFAIVNKKKKMQEKYLREWKDYSRSPYFPI